MNHDFYDKRAIFNRFKKISNIPSNKYGNKTKLIFYDCENHNHCRGCVCFNRRNKYLVLKKILIKYIFMKEYNPMKYYLYLWYKITFF